MVNCSVIRCKNRSERASKDVSFHRYPPDLEIRKKWILATGRHQWRPTEFHRMCSKHFERQCFQTKNGCGNKVFLDKLATPTLYVHTESVMEVKRRCVRKNEKLSMIRAIEAGEKISAVARRLSLSRNTVDAIWKKKCRTLRARADEKTKLLKKRLDQAVLLWFIRQRQENIPVMTPVVKAKADSIARKLGLTAFKTSDSWAMEFRERHDINFCKETKSYDFVLTKAQDAEPGSSKDPLRDSGDSDSAESVEQELLLKTVRQCRFCGSYGTECTDISYLSYLSNNNKTSIVFNEISIQLDFKKTNLSTAVCEKCNVKLQDMRVFLLLVKETQERLHLFNPGIKGKMVKKRKTVKKAAAKATADAECTKTTKKRIINDDDEDTRDAFEDEDLIECDVPAEYLEPDEEINEVAIKSEQESDEDDTKEGILDSVTLEETVVLKGSVITKELRIRKKDTEEGILDPLSLKKTVVFKDSTAKEDAKRKKDKEDRVDAFTAEETVVLKGSVITKEVRIRKKDTKEGMLHSLPAKEIVVLKDSTTKDAKRKKDKEGRLVALAAKENVVSKGLKRAKEDITTQKKVKVEEELVEFDITIEEETTTSTATNDAIKGYSEFGASGVGATSSAPKKVNYITIDGLTGTFSVEQGNKRRE